MTFLFLCISGLIIFIQYRREANIINLVSLMTAPYFAIVLFNNLFLVNVGFYRISDSVLLMIMTSLIFFFLGSSLATPRKIPEIYEGDNTSRFERYHVSAIRNVLLIIGIIGVGRVLLLIISGGFSAANFNDVEGLMTGGVVGHLLLMSYSILPIDFLYWLDNKKKISYLIPVLLIVAVTFSSFVKYNVIGVAITLFTFTCVYRRSSTSKAFVILIVSVIVLFVGNYALGFFIRSASVSSKFYISHLQSYFVGSVVYDNYLFPDGINTHISLGYKIMTFLMAFPNMFIKRLGGEGLFPHVKKSFLPIGTTYGQTSNVTDAFGYLFPIKQGILAIIIYYLLILMFGYIFSRMYLKAKTKGYYFNTLICNFMTYFVFLSFFGTFYISPGPWEILIYSRFIPFVFLKASNLRRGIIRLS